MPNQQLEQAVLNWIATFTDLTHKPETFESLSDGVVLTEIMQKIEPNIFDLSKINTEISDNWALRFTNLTFLYEGLETYYTEVLHKYFEKDYANIMKISKNDEREPLYNLVELVLGATVQSPRKEMYINAILGLDETCQNALMDLIEKILHICNPEQEASHTSFSINKINAVTEHTGELMRKLEELENENQSLNVRLSEMAQEKEHMKNKVNDLMLEYEKKNEEVKRLLTERESIQTIVNTQDSIEEFKNEIKLKDHKLEQLDQYIQELRQKQQMETARLEDEIEKQKKKVAQLTKIEGTIGFYEQIYKEYNELTRKIPEMEEELEKHKTKIDELNKNNDALQSKINTYKEKLEAEKTINISQDIELTKKKTEIETLKSEKKRLETQKTELEGQVQEQSKLIEKTRREHEEALKNISGKDRVMNQLAGQDFQEIMVDLEKRNKARNEEVLEEQIAAVAEVEGEKEILQQEIELLKTRCKEAQIENDKLKSEKNDTLKNVSRLNEENNHLKEEIEKLKKALQDHVSSSNNKLYQTEVENLKKQLKEAQSTSSKHMDEEDIALLKDEISEKTRLIGQLTEQIVELRGSSTKHKKLEDEVAKKNEEIKELNDELEAMRSILTESGEQKDEELRVLVAAVQELAVRNLELEKQLTFKVDGPGPVPVIKQTHSVTTAPQGYNKQRK